MFKRRKVMTISLDKVYNEDMEEDGALDNYDESQEARSRYADKLELVYREYEDALDLDIALTLVPLTDAERLRLIDDPDLMARIAVCDAKVKNDLMHDLRDLSKSAQSDGVKFAALKELGKTLYPRRFKDDAQEPKMPTVVRYELMEPLV
jgi:hypothetical protein